MGLLLVANMGYLLRKASSYGVTQRQYAYCGSIVYVPIHASL